MEQANERVVKTIIVPDEDSGVGGSNPSHRTNVFQARYTPKALAERMAKIANVAPGMTVLEPSAGQGDLAEPLLRRRVELTCVELNHAFVHQLRLKFPNVYHKNFLMMEPHPNGGFERIVMNPPMDAEPHVRHAFKFLLPRGRLVALLHDSVVNSMLKAQFDANDTALHLPAQLTVGRLPLNMFEINGEQISASLLTIDRLE